MVFQNCSEFKVIPEPIDTVISNSILPSPEIEFETIPDLFNTETLSIQFKVKLPPGQSMKKTSCQLNNDQSIDCSNQSVTYSNLLDGDYLLKVTAESQNSTSTTSTKLFRKDSKAPTLTISMTPPLNTTSTTATFVFSAADNLSGIASIECSIDNLAFSVCASPQTYTNLSLNVHNVKIRAQDRAGNASSVYSYSWTILPPTMPSVSITQTPAAVTNTNSAQFSFLGTNVLFYECQLDMGAYSACTSPIAFANLSSSTHIFRVRGTDSAGVTSSVASFQWSVDNVAPNTPNLMSDRSNLTNLKTASFNFSSIDSGSGLSSFQCSIDNEVYSICSSPKSFINLSDGSHTFRVKAFDFAGNSSTESSFTWLIDSIAPTLVFSQQPAAVTDVTIANFQFTVTENGSGITLTQCSFDNSAYANCSSPHSITVAEGMHIFRIQSQDKAGNLSSISYSWTVTSSTTQTRFNFVVGMDLTAPPNLLTPAINLPYIDQAYKTSVTRVMSASQITDRDIPAWVRHEYSRRPAFNDNSTQALAISSNGWFRLYNVDSINNKMNFVKTLNLAEPQEPNWHPTDPNLIYTFPYYGIGMTISQFDVRTNAIVGTSRNLSTRVKSLFPLAEALSTKQEGRPSDDGNIWCLIAWKYDSVNKVNTAYGLISYNYSTDQILGSLPITSMPDHISTSPSGKYCVPSWAYDKTLGTRSYTLDFKSFKMLHTMSEHSDLARDKAGRDVYILSDYDSGFVAMVDLETGVRTNLFSLYLAGGTATAMHISGIGTKRKPGYVAIGFYACTTNYGASPCSYPLHWFKDKIVLVELNANPKIFNLAHNHYGDAGYFAESQSVSNNDFSKVLFVSTWESTQESALSSYMIHVPIEALP